MLKQIRNRLFITLKFVLSAHQKATLNATFIIIFAFISSTLRLKRTAPVKALYNSGLAFGLAFGIAFIVALVFMAFMAFIAFNNGKGRTLLS